MTDIGCSPIYPFRASVVAPAAPSSTEQHTPSNDCHHWELKWCFQDQMEEADSSGYWAAAGGEQSVSPDRDVQEYGHTLAWLPPATSPALPLPPLPPLPARPPALPLLLPGPLLQTGGCCPLPAETLRPPPLQDVVTQWDSPPSFTPPPPPPAPPPSLLPPHSTLPANSLHHVSRDVQRGQQVLPLPSLSSHLGLSATTLPGAVRANTFTAALLTGLGSPPPFLLPSFPGQLQTPTCSVQPVLVN